MQVSLINQETATAQPNLYALVIGVSDFANANINLKFPNADAHAISNALELGAQNLFPDRYCIYTITSDSTSTPTKENIKKVFDEIAKKAKINAKFVNFFKKFMNYLLFSLHIRILPTQMLNNQLISG